MKYFLLVLFLTFPVYLLVTIVRSIFFVKSSPRIFHFFQKKRTLWQISISMFFTVIMAWIVLPKFISIDKIILPDFFDTINELQRLTFDPTFYPHLLISLKRIIFGFGLAVLIGTPLGILSGSFKWFKALITPLNSSLRYIPPTAFIGLTIIWFGIDEGSKVALIFLGVIFFIIHMIADVVKLVPREYIEAGINMKATRLELLRKIVIPFSLPEILAVLRVNLGASWTFLIVAEVVASQEGIGYLMSTSQRFLQMPKLFALIIITGILGFIFDFSLGLLIKRIEVWR